MAPAANEYGGSDYQGLYGAEFVERARRQRDGASFEAIWRLRQPEASRAVVESLASLGQPELADLLLDEALEAHLGPGFATDLHAAIREHLPPLSADGIQVLAIRISENPPPPEEYTPDREALELWLLKQTGPPGDQFASQVVTGQLAYDPTEACEAAALQRCLEDERLAERAARQLDANLAEEPDDEAWELGAAFVEAMSAEGRPPTFLEALTDRLVSTAAELSSRSEFGENLRRAMIALSATTVKKLLAVYPLADTAGARALVQLHSQLRLPRERSKVFVDVLDIQAEVWRAVGPGAFEQWSEDEWAARLHAVEKSERTFEQDLVLALLRAAPSGVVRLILPVATYRAEGPEDELVAVAATKLAESLDELRESPEVGAEEPAKTTLSWWPSGGSPDRLEVFQALLSQAIPETGDRLTYVVCALSEGAISATEASFIVRAEEFAGILALLEAGELRGTITREFAERDEDTLVGAVRQVHAAEGFQVDLAEVLASYSPETAFLGAEGALADLDQEGKGRLVVLLERFGRQEDVPVLDAIVQDTRAANREYRRRAALRIGEITPEGEALPASVVELLRSNRPELVDAAATVIGRVKPEDPGLVRLLRSVAIESAEGSEAPVALSSLTRAFVGRLLPDLPKETRVHLLQLLAAAAIVEVVDPLLGHVGRDALDDDPEVRRIAAAGLREVAGQVTLSPDQLQHLMGVIEEEKDPTAREDLQAAATRASLGEDAALEVLNDLLSFRTKHDLRELLGKEKDRVVRHLQLLATERERGEQGRPGVIMQLDIIAERILRTAYLHFGQSDALKQEISTSPKTPEYGQLIQALASVTKLHRIQGQLQTLHVIRSAKTEFTHTGDAPSDDDETTAWTCFKEAAKVMIGTLDRE
jgi:hypothetical protein